MHGRKTGGQCHLKERAFLHDMLGFRIPVTDMKFSVGNNNPGVLQTQDLGQGFAEHVTLYIPFFNSGM